MFSETIIVGKLAFDPEARMTKSGKQMTTMRIPVNTGSGDYKKTTWFNVTAFGKIAEACEKYLQKGDSALVRGSVELQEYESKGEKKYSIGLIADSVTFLSKAAPKQPEQSQPQPSNDDNPFVTDYTDVPF